MLETDLNIGGSYRDHYALGIGPSIGIIRDITDPWKLNLFANALYYELGDRHTSYTITAQQVGRLSRNSSLNADIIWKKEFDVEQQKK